MKTKDKKGVPKGRVMWFASKSDDLVSSLVLQPNRYGPSLDTPVAALPCRTPTQAKRLVSNWNAGEGELVERVAKAIDPDAKSTTEYFERRQQAGSTEPYYNFYKESKDTARAVLRELGYLEREGR